MRVDVAVFPQDPDRDGSVGVAALHSLYVGRGWLDQGGRVIVSGAAALGAKSVRMEQHARPKLWANQVGGFRVSCPECRGNLVPSFVSAQEAYRLGGPRSLVCPSCSAVLGLEACVFFPPAGYARSALVFMDVSQAVPEAELLAEWASQLGPVHWVARRS